MITSAVLTSKPAQKDYNNIVSKHADLVEGIANQAFKVQAYRQQKADALANEGAIQADLEKSKMVANTETQKNALDFQMRQAELDARRMPA